MNLKSLVRKNIWNLVPYSSARSEHKKLNGILLDANENSMGSVLDAGLNRYPDPHQEMLKSSISNYKGIDPENIFVGNGSDEAIDLLIRAFCEPAKDAIVIFPPTYGVYSVFARTNDVEVISVDQKSNFTLDSSSYKNKLSNNVKLTFICDPNNPSGNCYSQSEIESILTASNSIVIIDEAYIDFASRASWLEKLNQYPHLVVLQTLSKAWGLAGIRIGMAYASKEIIAILNKIKYPYNINQLTQLKALEAFKNIKTKDKYVNEIINQRTFLLREINQLSIVIKVFPSDANFLLIRFKNAKSVYQHLLDCNIIVRDRSNQLHCENCLRITIGKEKENEKLLYQLRELEKIL
jgi:histidinol-phosphate aminotransferase